MKLPRNYSKAIKNLELLKLKRGIWLDAGCGEGTYAIPLSFLVDKVIAIDTNENYLKILKGYIKNYEITNIDAKLFDFNNKFNFSADVLDGILLAFSLHFQKKFDSVLMNSYYKLKQKVGRIVIIEYETEHSVPWNPYPITEEKMAKHLETAKFSNISGIFKNSRFYILEAIKL
jgi:ubiquinone/menaquinone biosynthesis C-methylase UbiE